MLCRFKLLPSPLIRVSGDLDHLLFLVYFPSGLGGKASAYNTGDPGSIPGSGRSPGGNDNPLQYSCMDNSKTEKPGRLQSMGLQRVTFFPFSLPGRKREVKVKVLVTQPSLTL